MATYTNPLYANAYSSQGSVLGTSTPPVAVGPVPTPMPPSGVNYTPQYSGAQSFPTSNPTTYTSTPQGATELQAMQASTGTLPKVTTPSTPVSNQTSQNVDGGFDMKYYAGWDPTAALADWRATGGAKGKLGGSTGGTPDKTISKTGDPRAALVTSNPTTNADFNNSGMNIDDYLATIDQEYNNNNNLLNTQEASINAAQPGIEKGITDQATLLKDKAGAVKEDALSAAKRLYAELQQGYKQRFGGASSAGEAAMALTGNEQQRQMAQTNRSYQDSVNQVDLSASQAIQSAQNEFRNQLLQVQSNRTATENDRLNARRQALQGLSDKVYAIQQQATTFKQNLQLMQEQARLQNEANLKGMSTNPATTLTTNGMQTTASGNQGLSTAVGSINNMSTGMSKTTDPLANGVYPIASMSNGQMKYSDGSIR